eukprot:TRINITY_DN822_c0_g1_i2.p1 TRINITY_DN822_c0_g1~~TRINITY_DN822_c0_g1_i2.p1  ORF type:complete len:118 (-),score=37.66 TRINITY_DN822_c0_g1_i2:331-684(-)
MCIRDRCCIVPHLQHVGLDRYFNEADIYGQDCDELKAVDFVKAALIASFMETHSWRKEDVVFVDDSQGHIEAAQHTCEVFRVAKHGLSASELEVIQAAVLGALAVTPPLAMQIDADL